MRLILALLLIAPALFGADVLPVGQIYSWTNGIPSYLDIPNSYAMTQSALLSPSGGDDAAQINTALGNASSNQVVQLTNGTFKISSTYLNFQNKNGIVLRGKTNSVGYPTTIVQFDDYYTYLRSNYRDPYTGNTAVNLWTNLNKGDTTAVLVATAPSWIKVNHLYIFDELDDSFKVSDTTGEGTQTLEQGRGLGGMNRVVAIRNGTNIDLEMPVPETLYTSNTAHMAMGQYDPSTANPIMKVGLEDMVMWANYSGSTHFISTENADRCWFKNLVVTNSPNNRLLNFYGGYKCIVYHCEFAWSHAYSSGQGYGSIFTHGSSFNVVENCIFHDLHVSMQANYCSHGNVFFANYVGRGISTAGQDPGMNFHGIVASRNLSEMNYTVPKQQPDEVHGSGGYANTFFRNRIEGEHTNAFDPACINVRYYCRSNNFVANMLGDNAQNTYMVAYPGANNNNPAIYRLGYGQNGDEGTNALRITLALNWDTFTGTTLAGNGGSSSTSDLVTSYYRLSKPGYWGQCPWPAYGPDVGTNAAALSATNIPAGYRYIYGVDPPDAGGGGTFSNGTIPHRNKGSATSTKGGGFR